MRPAALKTFCVGLLLLAMLPSMTAAQTARPGPQAGPQGAEEGATRRQLWLIPIQGERLLMR